MVLSDEQRKAINCIDVADCPTYDDLLDQIDSILSAPHPPSDPHPPLRIAIHWLGSPGSPAASHSILFKFLVRLKSLLQPSSSVAMITFPSTIYSAQAMPMLCWATDGCLALESFEGNDASQTAFPNHQGVCHFLRLPSPASLSPPSTKLSVLRGLGASDSAEAGGIDTNLGFKVGRRKGFRIEMMGLGIDVEPRDDPASHPHSEPNINPEPAISEPKVESPKPKGKTKAKARVRFGGTDDLEDRASHKHPVKHLGNTDW